MAELPGNQLLPDEMRRQVSRRTTLQLRRSVSATGSIPDTKTPEGGGLLGGGAHDGTWMENQTDLQRRRRRRRHQAPYADTQSAPHPPAREASKMDFGASDELPAAFQVLQGPAPADPVSSAMLLPGATLGRPGPSLPMSGFPAYDTMASMVPASFASMSVNQMVPDHRNLNMFDPATIFDDSLGRATMGAVGSSFTGGANAEAGQVHGRPLQDGAPLDASGEDAGMLTYSNAVSSNTHDISRGSTPHIFRQNPFPGYRINTNANTNSKGHRAARRDLTVITQPSQPLPFSLPSQPTSRSPAATQDNMAISRTPAGPQPPPRAREKSIYSKSGFDLMHALYRVANRKNPQINIGPVDMSCAFVVCDVTLNDCPIIHASDSFQNLTGYTRHEIMGKNCRFLQAPDGCVEAGVKREFVDEAAVFQLKQSIAAGREVQQRLINYRKGGKPFLNILTLIPIPWGDTEDIRYFVGLQIDAVECPEAITSSHDAGGVKVDYANIDLGQHIWEPPVLRQWESENSQTLGVNDISTLLQQFFTRGAVASGWHKQSWHKMLLENHDDVVHVISLKGAFQYVSPSCKRVLEYDPGELAGSSLSSVCHPSDIVPITRELKDANGDAPVNLVFRIRRKHSGYMWFESHGSLFSEYGKGRKCIILLGRRRPIFSLSHQALRNHGSGLGDSDLWAKLSTSGMILFMSSNVRSLLDLQPETLVGTSIHELMRKESRVEFDRAIEKARRGSRVSYKHEVHSRKGQVLLAETHLYPGDNSESRPSFLLAQIKLAKTSSRSLAGSQKNLGPAQYPPKQGGAAPGRLSPNTPSGESNSCGQSPLELGPDGCSIFVELGTTRCSSWQFELRQMEKVNRTLTEELNTLLSNRKKRKKRNGNGSAIRECANCHTLNTPEWRRGPSGQRDLCNSCGLRWAKQVGGIGRRASASAPASAPVSAPVSEPMHGSTNDG